MLRRTKRRDGAAPLNVSQTRHSAAREAQKERSLSIPVRSALVRLLLLLLLHRRSAVLRPAVALVAHGWRRLGDAEGTSQFGGWQLECSADAGTRWREKRRRRPLCLFTIRSAEESRIQRAGKGMRVRQQPGMKLFMKKSLAGVGTRPGWRAILKVERPDNTRRWWSLVAGDWSPITTWVPG